MKNVLESLNFVLVICKALPYSIYQFSTSYNGVESLPNTDLNSCLESGQKVRVNTEMHEASLVLVKGLLLPLNIIKFIKFIIEIHTEEYLPIFIELLLL